jgi:transcriptional regulator with XRE-family HTH domain
MKNQLNKLIHDLGYTATRFADEIGVQRSGISHILSGRNQPSYDFIVKIANRFPDINLEWLILGKGNMKKITDRDKNISQTSLFNQENIKSLTELSKTDLSKNGIIKEKSLEINNSKVTNVTIIDKIVILNSDGTFNEYIPANKD